MTEAVLVQKNEPIDTESAALPRQLPDMTSVAENALTRALDFCAREIDLGPQAVAYRIQKGNSIACTCYRYGLAKQIAESLGSWDENVKAVYTLDYNAIPTDLCLSEVTQDTRRVHLLVWMQPETAAFDSLVTALDRALVQGYADVLGINGLVTLLEVQVIDDADVDRLIGYTAFLVSIRHRLTRFWEDQRRQKASV